MMTEVIAILVSVGLVLVTIVSAVLVWRTKQQARQAATRARTEAVNYLREAQSDLKNYRSVTPQAKPVGCKFALLDCSVPSI
jgi:type II secretory pathway pseudopilin PulG